MELGFKYGFGLGSFFNKEMTITYTTVPRTTKLIVLFTFSLFKKLLLFFNIFFLFLVFGRGKLIVPPNPI